MIKNSIVSLISNKHIKNMLLKIIRSNKYLESFLLKTWDLFISHKYQGLFIAHNMDDLYNGDFNKAYTKSFDSDLGHNKDLELLRMRVFNVVKALELSIIGKKNTRAMFVGVAHGFTAFTSLNYFKLQNIILPAMYLIDPFDGSASLENQDTKYDFYTNDINSVKKTFSTFKEINFIEGFIPDAIIDFNEKVNFIHLNTGDTKSENNSLHHLWNNLIGGG